jgi:hypothetical protein
MSTKTTFKRVALVAVASLGFGVLTSIAPASAAAGTSANANITIGSITVANASNRVGVQWSATATVSDTVGAAATTINAKSMVSTAPTGSAAVLVTSIAATTGSPTFTGATLNHGIVKVAATTVVSVATVSYTFTPDLAGSYTIMTWADQDDDGYLSTGEAYATKTFTVVANADAITAAITSYNTTAPTSAANGILAKITITNSAAAAASLSAGEVITATVSGSAKIGGSSGTASVQLNRLSFDGKGRAWINIYNATAESVTLSVTGTVGPSVAAISQTASYTFAAAAGDLATSLLVPATTLTGVKAGTAHLFNATQASATAGAWTVDPLKTTSVSIATTTTAISVVVPYMVQDVTGIITGKADAKFESYVTAGTAGVVSISAPAFTPLAATNTYTVVVGAVAVALNDISTAKNKIAVTATASTASTATKEQAATLRMVAGSVVTVSAVWTDTFGVAYPNQAVSVAVTGRNPQIAVQNSVTDATGRVSFTYTDAPLAGVTATADTVTFSGPNSTTAVYTANFVTAYTVAGVKINTPDTTAGVNNVIKATASPINAGSTGASGTVVAISADLTDAAGANYA